MRPYEIRSVFFFIYLNIHIQLYTLCKIQCTIILPFLLKTMALGLANNFIFWTQEITAIVICFLILLMHHQSVEGVKL